MDVGSWCGGAVVCLIRGFHRERRGWSTCKLSSACASIELHWYVLERSGVHLSQSIHIFSKLSAYLICLLTSISLGIAGTAGWKEAGIDPSTQAQ